MRVAVRRRCWRGFDGKLTEQSTKGENGDVMVYVTPRGARYHRYRDCQHLTNICKAVSKEELDHLRNNDGYIIRGINDDTGQQQFAPKPMRLTESSNSCYKLRGYGVNAQTPFGWQYVDLSDYGFEVKYKDGVVDCCILYMYDRNVRIEYYR